MTWYGQCERKVSLLTNAHWTQWKYKHRVETLYARDTGKMYLNHMWSDKFCCSNKQAYNLRGLQKLRLLPPSCPMSYCRPAAAQLRVVFTPTTRLTCSVEHVSHYADREESLQNHHAALKTSRNNKQYVYSNVTGKSHSQSHTIPLWWAQTTWENYLVSLQLFLLSLEWNQR